ncbi:LuxR C-terminal-related transcriptional regulator [Streptomyces sp. NPDC059017]|uniref:LuxR C-terminal-related transcriptional regulator n=1 Tax=unclassified Streptomyces TaxID=2593676 RepID=UPI0036897E0B
MDGVHGAGPQVSGLPPELTSFVGRRRETEEVKALLSTARLVTLTGPGGVGKTRLALRVARRVRRAFTDGVAFVELAPVSEGTLVAYSVAEALGFDAAHYRGDPLAVVTALLADCQTLVILDNCEHVVEACATLVDAVLRAGAQVHFLATSRQLLGVAGEYVSVVGALPVPGPCTPDRMSAAAIRAEFPAVALFAERAGAVAGFELTDDNCAEVARLCHRLDGLPLAIELAAVRTRVLAPGQILKQLESRIGLLDTVDRQAPERHRTLNAAMDWSYGLCSPSERVLWARASVFASSFELEAAQHVCGGDGLPVDAVLDAVTGLVDKSVLVREEHRGQARYRMLATLAQYGTERLAESGESQELAQRHRDWFLSLAEEMANSWWGPGQLQWSERMRGVHDDVRAALRFCLDTPGEQQAGLVLATSLHFYWFCCGHLTEGRLWLGRFLADETAPPLVRARALRVFAVLAAVQADSEVATVAVSECRALERHHCDPFLGAAADCADAVAAMGQGLLREAAARADRALACPAYARHPERSHALSVAVCARALLGEREQAAPLAVELSRCAEEYRADWIRSRALLGKVLTRPGPVDAAEKQRLCCEALVLARALDDALAMSLALMLIAEAALDSGSPQRGAVILGICRRFWRLVGLEASFAVFGYEQLETRTRQELGEAAFRSAVARGGQFATGAGFAYALGGADAAREPEAAVNGGNAPRKGRGSGPLTVREHQVAQLVAQGLSNKQIAARLVISPRTADGHVVHILSKLGFTSRAQIAAWAAERKDA